MTNWRRFVICISAFVIRKESGSTRTGVRHRESRAREKRPGLRAESRTIGTDQILLLVLRSQPCAVSRPSTPFSSRLWICQSKWMGRESVGTGGPLAERNGSRESLDRLTAGTDQSSRSTFGRCPSVPVNRRHCRERRGRVNTARPAAAPPRWSFRIIHRKVGRAWNFRPDPTPGSGG